MENSQLTSSFLEAKLVIKPPFLTLHHCLIANFVIFNPIDYEQATHLSALAVTSVQ